MDGQKSPERDLPPTLNARKFNGSWYVAVTWGNGRHERQALIKLKPLPKNASRRSWKYGMRAKSYCENALAGTSCSDNKY